MAEIWKLQNLVMAGKWAEGFTDSWEIAQNLTSNWSSRTPLKLWELFHPHWDNLLRWLQHKWTNVLYHNWHNGAKDFKCYTHCSGKETLAINQSVYLPRQTLVDEVPSTRREIFAELRHCYRATPDSKDGCHARHVGPGEKRLKHCLVSSDARLRVPRGGGVAELLVKSTL